MLSGGNFVGVKRFATVSDLVDKPLISNVYAGRINLKLLQYDWCWGVIIFID